MNPEPPGLAALLTRSSLLMFKEVTAPQGEVTVRKVSKPSWNK